MFKGLEALHSSGKISDELLEWAHYLRTTRNLGAHATEAEITQEAAAEALDFLQAILEILYELRPKFEKIKGKNKKRGPTRSAPR